MKRLIIIILALFTYGCEVSNVPIRSVNGKGFDSRLAGAWVSTKENTTTYLHVGKINEAHMGSVNEKGYVIIVEHTGKSMNMEKYPIISACLKSGCYVSVSTNDKDEPSYFLAKYSISESGILTVHYPDMDFLKSAVRSGKIRGKFSGDRKMFSGVLTSEDELRNFVEANSKQLFAGEKFNFARQK